MGRRATGKIPSDINLARYSFELDALDKPLGDGPFETARPLEVEVGSGKGLFMRTAAEACPDRNFIGIEISSRYAHYAAAQLADGELDNAIMVRGNGVELFTDHLQTAQLHAVHVYFPDPWWKKRHRKKRIMKASFLRLIQDRLVVGGELHFWTDVQQYFVETLATIQAETDLDGPMEVEVGVATHDMDYRTHFERRMRLNGEPIYRSRFIRR
jgi:tRNA (guanine-N7-)-methyltransferase